MYILCILVRTYTVHLVRAYTVHCIACIAHVCMGICTKGLRPQTLLLIVLARLARSRVFQHLYL